MIKIKLSEETRFGLLFFMGLMVLLLIMLLLNYFFERGQKTPFVDKEKEKTVIITQSKETPATDKLSSKTIVSSVRDAVKQGDYSTAYMHLGKADKGSPENEELKKLVKEETQKRKTPGVRKDTGITSNAPIRYFDESTPRNRTTDALYIYFVDISGVLLPRFCIQVAGKRRLGMTGFTITADAKKINGHTTSVVFENTEKGVAEWYDIPLDRNTYEAAQVIMRAKKVSLTITGSSGQVTRDLTASEIKGIRRVLDGFAALGGNLNYMLESKSLPPAHK